MNIDISTLSKNHLSDHWFKKVKFESGDYGDKRNGSFSEKILSFNENQ